ncbi:hypothetical protein M438DRAFT_32109 [Aureobasidium pullulans EXF-150]|uniref:Uncharacterized protein n=1 Tax=Aureobasidium pullulans EXF-150 TaxID=1043002 RepID=A0A074XDA3_AURPU|nr:uncharacterized protein M438DRAFT_32109 [Aureobasidium pullulans EXF-150]KEQ83393.1 hypothetical protein M438DRAFT_32109 [Aureobasidium pullulans EXF-150]
MGIHEASLGSSKHVSYLHSITSSCGWPDIFPTVLLAPSQRASRWMRSRSLIINTVKWSKFWWTRLLFQLVVSILCAPMIPGFISDKIIDCCLVGFRCLPKNTNSMLIVHSAFILSTSGASPSL